MLVTEKNIGELLEAAQQEQLEVALPACLELAARLNTNRETPALEYATQALSLAIKGNHRKEIALAHIELARFFLYISQDYSGAVDHCRKALQHSGELPFSKVALAYRLMGISQYFFGRMSEAEVYYQEALSWLRKIESPQFTDKEDMAHVFYNLAILNNSNENNFLRLHYLDQAMALYTEVGSVRGIALCNDGYAIYYFNEGEYEKAVQFHQRSIELFEGLNDEAGIARAINNMGLIYLKTGDYEKGFELMKKALGKYRMLNEKYHLAVALINLGNVSFESGKEELALQYLHEAFDILQHSENDQLLCELYDALRKIAEARGDFEKAYKYQNCWIVYNNAIHNDDKKKSINYALAKATSDQKENAALFEEEKQRQIRNYIRKLEAVNHDLEQFVHAAAHDLREPLRSIKSFAELLQRRMSGSQEPQIREYTDFISESATRMDRVIHDLLDYSGAVNASEDSRSVSLENLLKDVRANLHTFLSEKNAEVILVRSGEVFGPPSQLRRLFENLIVNGIKFNHSEKPVVKVTYTLENDFHRIDFKDNGIGIDKKYHDRIFKIFQRLHKRTEFDGTGMGLTLCKKIVDRLHGRIELSSKEGKGAIFSVYLPV
ncbi:MAG: tetratricopeptide repeat protein [Chitinophagales bacterium]